jgi:hypothetical protein
VLVTGGVVVGGGASVVDVVVLVLVDVVEELVVEVEVLVLELDEVVGGSAAEAGPASASPSVSPARETTAHDPWCWSRCVSATHPPLARAGAGGADPRTGL